MPAIYATLEDVETDLMRTLTPAQAAKVAVLLQDASAMLRGQVVRLDARLADGTLESVLVKRVVTNMVVRVMRVVDPLTRTERIGDTHFEYDIDQLRAELEATVGELTSLAPKAKRSPVGMARTRPVL